MFTNYKKLHLQEDLVNDAAINYFMDNKFMFSRKYDMERCDQVYSNSKLSWDYTPNGDPEWTFVLNRMDYCIDLIVYSIKTKNSKYALKAKEFIFDWINNNTSPKDNKLIRTLDTGIRITVWNECIQLLKYLTLLNEDEYQQICASISWQVQYIHECSQNFQQFSNWGMMQAIGLLNAQLHVKDKFAKQNELFFNQHLNLQYFEDGMHHEQSSVYLLEVTLRLLQMRNERYKNVKYYELLKNAAYAIEAITNINNKSIALGDGDEIDTIGILQMIAFETKDRQLLNKLREYEIREESYWHYGDDIIAFLNQTGETEIFDSCYSFEYAGYEMIRRDNFYLSFQNGTIGGTHGHFDNLHFNYSVKNTKVFSDCGRYTYVEKEGTRVRLKSELGHNIVIPQKYNLQCIDVWKNRGMHMRTPIKKIEKGGFVFFKSSHMIFEDKYNTRIIIVMNDNSLIIADYLNDKYYVNFNFDHELKMSSVEEKIAGVGSFVPIYYDKIVEKTSVSSPIYNTLKEIRSCHVYAEEEVCINSFILEDNEINKFTDFEYLHYDRLSPYEKKYKLIEVKNALGTYVIGIKMIEGANCDNCIKIDDEYIFGTVFVYNRNTKEKIIFEQ